jgi:DNA-binding CsgD family transcriptional regulator
MLSEEQYDRLVGLIYDAAIDQRLWTDVVNEIIASFGVRYTSIFTPFSAKVGLEPVWSTNVDPRYIADYAQKYAGHDCLVQALWRRIPVKTLTYSIGDLFLPGEFESWEFTRDLLKPRGVDDVVGIVVDAEDHRASQLNLYYPYLPAKELVEAKRSVTRLGPHLSRALKIHWQVSSARQMAGSAEITLDMFQLGVVWVNREGLAVYRNTEADRLIALGEGIGISPVGVLTVQLQAEFLDAIGRAEDGVESVITIERNMTGPFRLRVTPLPMRADALRLPQAVAIIFISESVPPLGGKIERARQMFKLTPAEGRVLKHLAAGLDVTETARETGAQVSTVRTQVKAILAKCGAARQADLVRIVAYLP